jgi:hypothetical protein
MGGCGGSVASRGASGVGGRRRAREKERAVAVAVVNSEGMREERREGLNGLDGLGLDDKVGFVGCFMFGHYLFRKGPFHDSRTWIFLFIFFYLFCKMYNRFEIYHI